MAFTGEVCGFEGGDGTGCTLSGPVTITQSAVRTGSYGCRINAVATNDYSVQVGQGLAGFASQTHHGGFCQFCFRLGGAPSANNSMFCGFQDWMWLSAKIDGTLTLHCAGIGTITPGVSFKLNVLDTTTWYRCIMSIYAPTDSTGNRICLCMISHYAAGSTVLDFFASTSLVAPNIGFTAVTPFTIGSLPGNGGPNTTWLYDVDDCVYAAASGADFDTLSGISGLGFCLTPQSQWVNLTSPLAYDQVWPVVITAQGTHNDFTPAGRFDLINEIPKGAGQISSAAGWTNYTTSGISGLANATVVEAWTFRCNATAAPQDPHYLTASVSGVDTLFTVTISGISAGANASSLMASTFYPTSLITALEPVGTFNSTQFGVENNNGASTITIQNMYIEALSGNPNFVPTALNSTVPTNSTVRDAFATSPLTCAITEGKGTPIFTEGPASPVQWGMQRLDIRLDIEEEL